MLSLLSNMYWGAAIFFSVLFLWQLLATLFGGAGGDHSDATAADTHVDMGGADAADHDVGGGDVGHEVAGHDVQETAVHGADSVASFRLLSVRSITAFGLLFGWAGVLYLRANTGTNWTILYSILWGGLGMLIVSAIFYFLLRMTESGTRRLSTAVGERASVYMDIPAGGAGQVKCLVSGAVSFVVARSAGGAALKAGTPVVVKRILDANTVEVEKTE